MQADSSPSEPPGKSKIFVKVILKVWKVYVLIKLVHRKMGEVLSLELGLKIHVPARGVPNGRAGGHGGQPRWALSTKERPSLSSPPDTVWT